MNRLWKQVAAAACCCTMVMGMTGNAFAEDADSIYTEPGTYPIVTEEITLRIMIMSKPYIEDYNTNDFTLYMEELTGINLEIEAVSYEDSQEKMNLAMAGGDYPDIIMMLEPDVVKYGVKEGMFLQLDDMIEENMPNFMERKADILDSLRQSDGHIYGMPSINEAYHTMYWDKLWANSATVTSLGAELPTTTEELYQLCETFLAENPNGVAIADNSTGDAINWLLNAFILTPDASHGAHDKTSDLKCIVDPDGNVISAATQDAYREGLRYIKSLYDMGAYYEGNFSATADSMKSLINQEGAPVLFFPSGYSAKQIDSTASNELYRQYEVISPVEGPEGVQVTPYYYNDGLYENRFVVTDACEYPEAALRFLDWFYTEESLVMANYGTETGVDYIWEPEGEVGLNGEPAMYQILNKYSTEVQNHDWQVTGNFYATSEVRLGDATDPDLDPYDSTGLEKLLYQESQDKMAPYSPKEGENNILPVLHLTSEENDEIAIALVEVSNYMSQCRVSFINGTMDLDADWDSYVEQLNSLGLQTILDVYQAAKDR